MWGGRGVASAFARGNFHPLSEGAQPRMPTLHRSDPARGDLNHPERPIRHEVGARAAGRPREVGHEYLHVHVEKFLELKAKLVEVTKQRQRLVRMNKTQHD